MNRIAVVVPLKPDAYERTKVLLEEGPPFDLEGSSFERHEVFLTRQEAVFVFEGPEAQKVLSGMIGEPALWRAAAAWQECMAARPRLAEETFAWERA